MEYTNQELLDLIRACRSRINSFGELIYNSSSNPLNSCGISQVEEDIKNLKRYQEELISGGHRNTYNGPQAIKSS